MGNESVAAIPLDFKLYVEGVPVPMIRATITSTINQPATAQIHIPATSLSVKFEPRSAVHIFYLDRDDVYDGSGQESRARKGTPKYKLLFEGEYLGLGFRKTPSNRSTILRCVDLTNNFDYAHKFVLTASNPLVVSPVQRIYAGSKEKADVGVSAPITDAITRLITDEANVVEGVQELIRQVFVGGDKVETNDFLLSVERRFGISDKVVSIEDPDVLKLVSTKQLLNLMFRGLSRKSSHYTLGQMIQLFLSYIKYQRSTLLTPQRSDDLGLTYKSIVLNPNLYFVVPPKCNVLFPDHITSLGFQDNFMEAPTRLLMQAPPTLYKGKDPATMSASTYIAPPGLAKLLPVGGNKLSKPNNNYHRVLTAEERIKGITPAMKSLGDPEYVAQVGADKDADPDGLSPDSTRAYLINLAEYEYDIMRAATRVVDTMVGGFNPQVVVGAPAVILDPELSIYGMMESVSHSVSAVTGEGSSTAYQIRLPRLVSNAKFDVSDLSSEAVSEIDRIDSIILDDFFTDTPSKVERLDLKVDQENLQRLGIPLELIALILQIDGSAIDDRESKVNEWKILLEEGIEQGIPARPRWLNSNFDDFDGAGDSYLELYGCDSIVEPFDGSDGGFFSTEDAAEAVMREYLGKDDPFLFVKRYTSRDRMVNQTDFETHYGLKEVNGDDAAYSTDTAGLTTDGIFTSERQSRVKAYVEELRSRTAHLG
jgi:hypothetical protein